MLPTELSRILANGAAGHDLITFDGELSGTIELSIGHLAITSDMTIEGPGSGTITIDANGTAGTNRRAFSVSGDVTTIISGLTLTGGYAYNGGAVYAYTDSDVTLTDLVVTGNESTYAGGGVFSGYVRLHNTIVAGNTATSSFPDVRGYYDSGSSNNLIGIESRGQLRTSDT